MVDEPTRNGAGPSQPAAPTVVPSAPPSASRRVYALVGVPPEIQAYAMAKYSRSAQSMLDSVREISAQKAEQFLNTFYFQYGHRSIADMAHLVLAVENVSILAAIHLVDEPLWDGQERSTRYQDFSASGYYVPPEVRRAGQEALFHAEAGALFGAYERLAERLAALLARFVARPDDMDERQYRRTLRARAFDVARGLLPLATHTSVGQIVSARVAERQISRLLAEPWQELQELGVELRQACLAPAEQPLAGAAPEVRAAPTLVKYTQPSQYPRAAYAALAEVARTLETPGDDPDTAVRLVPPQRLLDELATTLLYRADPLGRSYTALARVVEALPAERKQAILAGSVAARGPHDELLREHRCGYPIQLDLCLDIGAFRDLHRHRRCVQVIQPFTARHGFQEPEEVFRLGLGEAAAEAARAEGLVGEYRAALERAGQAAERVSVYLLPLAYRVRALFKMDVAEAAYISELRTAPAGHFSYRHAAWTLVQELLRAEPHLAPLVHATNPTETVDLLRR